MGYAVRFALMSLVAGLVLVVAAAIVVPMGISSETIVRMINERVALQSGHKIEVQAPATLRILPSLKVELGGVNITNPGENSPNTQLKNVAVQVNWTTLLTSGLSGEITLSANDTPLRVAVNIKPQSAQNWQQLAAQLNVIEPVRAYLVADVTLSAEAITVKNIAVEMPITKGAGEVTIGRAQPGVSGALHFTMLDIQELQDMGAALALAASAGDSAEHKTEMTHDKTAEAVPLSVPDFSTLPVDVSLTADQLQAFGSSWGKAALSAKTNKDSLTVSLQELAAYSGTVKGALMVESLHNGGVVADLDAAINGVDMGAVLAEVKKQKPDLNVPVSGRISAEIKAKALGQSVVELTKTLAADVSVQLKDAVVTGVDSAALANLEDPKLVEKLQRKDAKTKLSEARATVHYANDAVTVETLEIAAPRVNISAQGKYYPVDNVLDVTVSPTIRSDDITLVVPTSIKGLATAPELAFEATARGKYNGMPLDVHAVVPKLVQTEKQLSGQLSVSAAQPLQASLTTEFRQNDGKLTLPNLLVKLPQAGATLGAAVEKTGQKITVNDLKITAPNSKGTGQVSIDTANGKQAIVAALNFNTLDVDELKAMLGGSAVAGGNISPKKAQQMASSETSSEGWSRMPIDVSGLRGLHVDATLVADSFRSGSALVNQLSVNSTVRDGVLQVQLKEARLKGGMLSGALSLDASPANTVPVLNITLSSKQIDVGQVLAMFTKFDRLSGIGALDVAAQSKGASQFDLVQHLDGKGNFTLEKGEIRGVDVEAMATQNPQAIMNAFNNPQARTPIDQMKGTFIIEQGVVKNNDLIVVMPYATVGGYGEINLPPQTIAYQLTPQVSNNKGALLVPVAITGSLSHPRIQPDMSKVAAFGLEKLSKDNKEVKKIVDKLDGLGVPGLKEGLLQGVLGGGAKVPGKPEQPQKQPAPVAPQKVENRPSSMQ